jgi:hypothetical protein
MGPYKSPEFREMLCGNEHPRISGGRSFPAVEPTEFVNWEPEGFGDDCWIVISPMSDVGRPEDQGRRGRSTNLLNFGIEFRLETQFDFR